MPYSCEYYDLAFALIEDIHHFFKQSQTVLPLGRQNTGELKNTYTILNSNQSVFGRNPQSQQKNAGSPQTGRRIQMAGTFPDTRFRFPLFRLFNR